MTVLSLNDNWLFGKYGEAMRVVALPHDAMICEKRDADLDNGSAGGYFPGGKYIYEKVLPDMLYGKKVIVCFDGVYRNSVIKLNGTTVFEHKYGYTRFFVDISESIIAGKNVLRVEVDNSETPNSRWYTGSGIYRDVRLYVSDKSYIKPDGVKINTVSINPAIVHIDVDAVDGDSIVSEVWLGEDRVAVGNGCCDITVPNAMLWSDQTPVMYDLRTFLYKNGIIVDTHTEKFGIRKITWNSTNGLMVNDRSIKLRGGCVHHDNGLLGAASFFDAEKRKIEKLKSFGFNAIRFSHNPIGSQLLNICDELGMYVLDEAFDVWKISKNKYDYSIDFDANCLSDIEAMVSNDYNHPSVIMYSIGNEITDTGFPFGTDICKLLCDKIRSIDTSRPITCGLNIMISCLAQKAQEAKSGGGTFGSQEFNSMDDIKAALDRFNKNLSGESLLNLLGGICDTLDIIGFNYGEMHYEKLHAIRPDYVFLSTETFPQKLSENWARVERLPYLVGDFMWSAWDYLGEAGVGLPIYGEDRLGFAKPYPCLTAYCGSFDIIGNPDPQGYLAAILWGKYDKPYIAVRPVDLSGMPNDFGEWRLTDALPAWESADGGNHIATIEVYSGAHKVELFLNGLSLGKQVLVNNCARYNVPYESGELVAIAYDQYDNKLSISSLKSPLKGRMLRAEAEKNAVKKGELSFINISVVDQDGTPVFFDDLDVSVEINGGRLIAYGSADPCNEQPYNTKIHKTYHGKLLAIISAENDFTAIFKSNIGNAFVKVGVN